jgi:phage terminase large subunit-like protein
MEAPALGVGELDSRGYVLHDASGKYTPDGWARMAVALFDHYRADRIVSEANLPCGEIVTNTLATVRQNLSVKLIHAKQGKRSRAEPVAALYEQGRVAHAGLYAELEDQLTSWDAGTSAESPDRLDALVHGLTELMLGDGIDTKLFTRQELERAAARWPKKPAPATPEELERQFEERWLYRG